jgi:hypothetical protein
MTSRNSEIVMNSSKKIESAFSPYHCSEGNTQALKRPRFEVKHGFALEDIDMNDAVDEIYALEVIMVITQFLFHVLIYTYVFQAVLVRFETRML